jgi:UDP-2,3-diacylglucosamine hydrolase
MSDQKKYLYFASDLHLGAPDAAKSESRERAFIAWLDYIRPTTKAIYLLGDVFDFWFEYKTVVPKGYTRLLGKLAELTDAGIDIHFFKGNHDMWVFDYFEKELGLTIHSDAHVFEESGKVFYLHHGDGLGPGDYKYKLLKRFFRSGICQWLFARLHPNFGIGLASFLSKRSRANGGAKDAQYNGPEAEWLFQYVKERETQQHHDYYLFGHRHLPLYLQHAQTRYVNTGDWLQYCTFARFDSEQLELLQWADHQVIPYHGR